MTNRLLDLNKFEFITCICGNTAWSLRVIEKTRTVITHIRIECSRCDTRLPISATHHYTICDEPIHFLRGPSEEDLVSKNLDSIKNFFDPHPGSAGTAIPIPAAVKRVANELSGKSMSLRSAIAKIQAVTSGKVDVAKNYDFIKLEISEDNGIKHSFRVISFK